MGKPRAGASTRESRGCSIVLVADHHRRALDVGIFVECVLQESVLFASGSFHVDHAEPRIPRRDLKRDGVVRCHRLVRERRDLGRQKALGSIGLDHDLGRLARRRRASAAASRSGPRAGPIVERTRELGPLSSKTAAAQRHSYGNARAGRERRGERRYPKWRRRPRLAHHLERPRAPARPAHDTLGPWNRSAPDRSNGRRRRQKRRTADRRRIGRRAARVPGSAGFHRPWGGGPGRYRRAP